MSRSSQTRKRGKVKKAPIDRDKALLITSSVPGEKGFHFFTDLEKPTGIFATSLFDFLEQLKTVDLESLEFHLKRSDFQKWLREIIRDDWLADQFERLRALDLAAEKLRARLVDLTEERCKQLSDELKHLTV